MLRAPKLASHEEITASSGNVSSENQDPPADREKSADRDDQPHSAYGWHDLQRLGDTFATCPQSAVQKGQRYTIVALRSGLGLQQTLFSCSGVLSAERGSKPKHPRGRPTSRD